jgi:hypothetical protein
MTTTVDLAVDLAVATEAVVEVALLKVVAMVPEILDHMEVVTVQLVVIWLVEEARDLVGATTMTGAAHEALAEVEVLVEEEAVDLDAGRLHGSLL